MDRTTALAKVLAHHPDKFVSGQAKVSHGAAFRAAQEAYEYLINAGDSVTEEASMDAMDAAILADRHAGSAHQEFTGEFDVHDHDENKGPEFDYYGEISGSSEEDPDAWKIKDRDSDDEDEQKRRRKRRALKEKKSFKTGPTQDLYTGVEMDEEDSEAEVADPKSITGMTQDDMWNAVHREVLGAGHATKNITNTAHVHKEVAPKRQLDYPDASRVRAAKRARITVQPEIIDLTIESEDEAASETTMDLLTAPGRHQAPHTSHNILLGRKDFNSTSILLCERCGNELRPKALVSDTAHRKESTSEEIRVEFNQVIDKTKQKMHRRERSADALSGASDVAKRRFMREKHGAPKSNTFLGSILGSIVGKEEMGGYEGDEET
ncbi:hypothetical protein EJ08DRAFT_665501 [Tothia fuscella]|uniref:J domain-containing protein n=1 Tax=Tothia fuscella TaxID=1048955 RepID=A0A9P4NGH6_9PEZI|nr:hypothetical protein EJ08DRAFT_665501 [Tothia fuscella]